MSVEINRRDFIKRSSIATAAIALSGEAILACSKEQVMNKLPMWRGFNLLDYFNPNPTSLNDSNRTSEDDFKWMQDWGFDFVRIPMAYPRYLNYDYQNPITAEGTVDFDMAKVEELVKLVDLANKYNLHVSLNLHRAPGYCVNAGFFEPFNLWIDNDAQEAFLSHWKMWAEVFKDKSAKQLSFDLVNEPSMREDMNDQYGSRTSVPGETYRKVAKASLETIRAISPDRIVIADGNDVGSSVIPEIVDLDIGQSCRGYYPHYVSHYQASWVFKDPSTAPMPVWPGEIDGQFFDRTKLEEFYKPWIDLVKQGTGVHCGECGCWRNTPHEVFLSWFSDVLDILTSNKIGYSLWNFRGDFGILDSGRKDIEYKDWYGHQLDAKLLELLQKY